MIGRLYGRPNCPVCERVISFLKEKGLYKDNGGVIHLVSTDEDPIAQLGIVHSTGTAEVPVFVSFFTRSIIVGFGTKAQEEYEKLVTAYHRASVPGVSSPEVRIANAAPQAGVPAEVPAPTA